jgi:DNA (cytosine-5)-methyltransferase 1
VENVAALRRRGLDRVLGDLAAHGYDAVWTSVRASDVGAAHRRERVFVLAYSSGARHLLTAADASCQRWARWPDGRSAARWRPPGGPQRLGADLVPGWPALAKATRRSRHLAEAAEHPRQLDAGGGNSADGGKGWSDPIDWGRYEPVIRRWETITGRAAPRPTERGTRGQTRLAAIFSEWLMGLPQGFVTDLDLPYGAQHRVLGNGVVPQQAIAALAQLTALAVKQFAADRDEPDAVLAA